MPSLKRISPLLMLNISLMYPSLKNFILLVLGQSTPLKLILSKCISDWKLTGEVNILDMGNGFSSVKFTNALDCQEY